MAPIPRSVSKKCIGRRSLEKRAKASLHVQTPRAKQKKLTDFFSSSPKPNGNKNFSAVITVSLENQSPRQCTDKNSLKMDTSSQKFSYCSAKTDHSPRLYDYVPNSSSFSPTKISDVKVTKQILKENNAKIKIERKKVADNMGQVTCLLKVSNTNTDIENICHLPKSPVRNIYKPQQNTRRKNLKYGTRLPTFNDIVKSREEFLKFKEMVACVAELQKDPPLLCDRSNFQVDCEEKEDILSTRLDCKYLSIEKLQDLLRQHTDFVIGIGSGKISSDRHELYLQDPFGNSEFDRSALTFNISMSAFTSKQKTFLATLVRKVFSTNKLNYNNQYYFKVILPELCLKIFMQEHEMTVTQATEYLSNPLLT